jgi:hypothetical protein
MLCLGATLALAAPALAAALPDHLPGPGFVGFDAAPPPIKPATLSVRARPPGEVKKSRPDSRSP